MGGQVEEVEFYATFQCSKKGCPNANNLNRSVKTIYRILKGQGLSPEQHASAGMRMSCPLFTRDSEGSCGLVVDSISKVKVKES
jgi:hypothetical protein